MQIAHSCCDGAGFKDGSGIPLVSGHIFNKTNGITDLRNEAQGFLLEAYFSLTTISTFHWWNPNKRLAIIIAMSNIFLGFLGLFKHDFFPPVRNNTTSRKENFWNVFCLLFF